MVFIHYNRNFKQRAQELRRKSTLGEVLLWNEIKNKRLGFQFYRQKPILNYIVDFLCKDLSLIIEIDGSSHDMKVEEDLFRQGELESLGFRFLRFTEDETRKDLERVVREIKKKISEMY